MTLSRRNVLKLGLSAGAVSVLDALPLASAEALPPASLPPGAPKQRVLAARPLPLHDVRLTGGPLWRAQRADMTYLLELEPDRMLAYYRQNAGLTPKAKPYGGWDGGGRNLTGHIAGHYLSAVSAMWAATGDARFRERADYIVRELAAVQAKHGDGWVGALEGGRTCFDALARGEIRATSFDLNGEWSPWYTLHKTFAGLRDAYRYAGSRAALEVERGFAGWAERVLAPLSRAQLEEMMEAEFGGMNEVLVDLYADTGEERWLTLSYAFEHETFVRPLQRHRDVLGGTHANTQIPKLIGSAERFAYTRQAPDIAAASFFYDQVVQHHSFASGGHGTDEYFGAPDHLGDRVHGRTAESCNVYNMLKMSRQLYALGPDAHYADFHERALFNHALASFDPETRRMCYMVPVGPGVTHEYQDMFESFTCCVGSGMENHALAGDGLYYESGDRLVVNIYAPSTARWAAAGASLTMETGFPEGDSATLTLTLRAPKSFTLALRRPYWAGEGFAVKVNGVPVANPIPEHPIVQAAAGVVTRRQPYGSPAPVSSYVEVTRTWRTGDVVEIALPKTVRLEATPDMPDRVAIMWGPLLLAGDLGPEPARRRGEGGGGDGDGEHDPAVTPLFVAANVPVSEWVVPVPGEPGRFRTRGVGREPDAAGAAHDVDLVPFYRLHRRSYATYWDLVTPEQWEGVRRESARQADRARRLEAATIAFVRTGRADSEKAFGYRAGEGSATQWMLGRTGRSGRSWFSYELPVQPDHPMAVVTTYYSADRRTSPASFDVLVDGERIATQLVERADPGRFHDAIHAVPAALVRGKSTVTVRFQARERSQIAALYGVRMVRADELP